MAEDETTNGGAEADSGSPAPETDRRAVSDRRRVGDRRKQDVPVEVERRSGTDRRKVQRRRRRGPNQYELSQDELEFINAIRLFKDQTGRPFPTWSEVLRILRGLGYEKRAD
ncbi:MAG: hypothetical protein QNJ98_03870 [Planctomycetota bacterium]|nr:hypothetical protein [Planctomycetota bacterium]